MHSNSITHKGSCTGSIGFFVRLVDFRNWVNCVNQVAVRRAVFN